MTGVAIFTLLLAAPLLAQDEYIAPTGSWQEDETIDVLLNAIRGPVVQPYFFPPNRIQGAPEWPLYKQLPPAAQSDFRQSAAPVVGPVTAIPPTAPGTPPGTPDNPGAPDAASEPPASSPPEQPPADDPPSDNSCVGDDVCEGPPSPFNPSPPNTSPPTLGP